MPAVSNHPITEFVRSEFAVTQFILKVHSRCDLACDHCYVYEHVDQSWQGRPKAIEPGTVARAADRIAEHAARHGTPEVRVILHGGEPLLLGPRRMAETLHALRATIAPVAKLDLRLHTNGVRLSPDFCAVFDEYDVRVGISLDGGRQANDRHRRFADGRSSHMQVLDGLRLLRSPEHRHLYAGILCTVDTRNDPVSVYEALIAQEPPRVDFLLPHATWAVPPARHHDGGQEYAAWLLAIYQRWLTDGRPVSIRTFESIEDSAHGGRSRTETLGADAIDLVIIETDGAYEQVDSLKIAYPGAPETGFNVFAHSVDVATGHPGFAARRSGINGLSATCQSCPVVRRCGGGFYPHRYAPENGFDNPSVYCEDLVTLVESIPSRAQTASLDVPATVPVDDVPTTFVYELIDGLDTPKGLGALAVLQNRINRAVIAAMALSASADETATSAWEALVRLEKRNSDATSQVFDHAHLRAWAARHHVGGAPDGETGLLEALAITAAVRGGQAERLTVRSRGREIHLPDLGTLRVPGTAEAVVTAAPGCLVVEVADDVYEVDLNVPDKADQHWRPISRLDATGLSVTLDDADPHRDCYGWPLTDRLDPSEVAAWRRDFAAAIGFLDAYLPHYAAGMRSALRTIVPLLPDPGGDMRSASAWNTFGSVSIARTGDPETLALALIHELQHIKLYALLDIAELYDKQDATLYYAPWRRARRPMGGFLHGTYAHVAVTEYWYVQSRIRPAGAARRSAHEEFAKWRAHTEDALATLLGSGRLTESGRRLAERARESMSRVRDG